MGVFDFLKKTQDDAGNTGQTSATQTKDPNQSTTAPAANDVQASYGSFFSNPSPGTSNVTYPLPSAGATLAPNYGAGVQPATTTASDDDDEKDDLDITNTAFLPKSEPIPMESDPLLTKKPISEFGSEVKNETVLPTDPKIDNLDLTSNTPLDFSAPIPEITADVSKQLEAPVAPVEPVTPVTTEELKAELETQMGVDTSLPTTTIEPTQDIAQEPQMVGSTESGNDTESPSSNNTDDFNPPLDSLVFNTVESAKGDWNPQNAFMSATNEGVANENVTPAVDLQSITPETTPNDMQPVVTQDEKTPDDSVDWLKDLEVANPLENAVTTLESPADTLNSNMTPIVEENKAPGIESTDDIPDWMKEFEAMKFDPEEQEKKETAEETPAVDLVTELPVEVIPDKKKKNKTEKEVDSKELVGDIKFNDEETTEETKEEAPAVETSEVQIETLQLKYFRDVALVGLNSDISDASYSNLVKDLVNALKTSVARLVIDSSQGHGKTVLDSLKDTGSLEVNGAYLRPYFSAYSDEPNGEVVDVKNYTETLFSNFVERLRYLYTSSELFIVLDSKGLVNLADISFLLAMQKMYYGKHKPVILFGAGWTKKMETLNAMLNDDEKDKVYVVKDVNELATTLKSIEEGYTKNDYYSTKRVTDLRDIEDEKQFMI